MRLGTLFSDIPRLLSKSFEYGGFIYTKWLIAGRLASYTDVCHHVRHEKTQEVPNSGSRLRPRQRYGGSGGWHPGYRRYRVPIFRESRKSSAGGEDWGVGQVTRATYIVAPSRFTTVIQIMDSRDMWCCCSSHPYKTSPWMTNTTKLKPKVA